MIERLSPGRIKEKLRDLQGWTIAGDNIKKEYEFKSFMPAVEFINRIAPLAEAADHHPDITLQYRHVTLSLSTHSEGGLTLKDFELARKIDGVAAQ